MYAINFGAEKDRNLQAIALETGGAVFDAADREELAGVYDAIRRENEQAACLTGGDLGSVGPDVVPGRAKRPSIPPAAHLTGRPSAPAKESA